MEKDEVGNMVPEPIDSVTENLPKPPKKSARSKATEEVSPLPPKKKVITESMEADSHPEEEDVAPDMEQVIEDEFEPVEVFETTPPLPPRKGKAASSAAVEEEPGFTQIPPRPKMKKEDPQSRLQGTALSIHTDENERNRLKKLFRPKRQIKNVTQDENRPKSSEELLKEATLELERASRGYILTGVVSAVGTDRFGAHAIIFYKNLYKICIYAQQFREWPPFSLERYDSEEDMHFKVLKKQIGATIDFMIMRPKSGGGIDIDNRTAIGDRMAAMRVLRKEYWMPDKNGQTKIRNGSRIDARIVNLTNSTAIVESGGVEIKIPVQEMSWTYLQNVSTVFEVGQNIPIDIVSILYNKQPDGSVRIDVQASHKTTQPNVQYEAARHLAEGMIMRGIVTNTAVASSAVFVELENGAVVRCPPPNGVFLSPALGDAVNCLIRKVKMEVNPPRIDGEIRGVLKRNSTY